MMRNERKTVIVVILIVSLLFLPGCWGKNEVENLTPLIGLGIDLGQKPGTYLVTGQFAKPKQSGETGAEVEGRTISVEASSAREAYEKIYKVFYRVPFMGSLKVIVIGEDIAKAGFIDMLDFLQRFSEFRRSMYLVLAKGKAQTLLDLKLRAGQITTTNINNHIEQGDKLSSFPTVRLGHYLTILGTESTAPILPVVEGIKPKEEDVEYKAEGMEGAEEIQIKSAGVFDGDNLVDFLTEEETKGYMWLENNVVHRFINTVHLEENDVKFAGQVLKSRTKYKVVENNRTKGLDYQIKTSIAVDEILGLNRKLTGSEWEDLMEGAEKSFAKVIEKECELAIQREKKLGLDFLGIGRHIEQKDVAFWKTIKDNWKDKIGNFPLTLDVQVKIHHSGMSSNSVIIND